MNLSKDVVDSKFEEVTPEPLRNIEKFLQENNHQFNSLCK